MRFKGIFMKRPFMLSLILMSTAYADQKPVMGFEELWSKLMDKSSKIKQASFELESADLADARSSRHWLPRAYVTGQWFETNDSAAVFFNNLGQRAVTQADFSPATLNHPVRQNFRNATLGIDLPLYEGGMKSNQSQMMGQVLKASELELKAKKTEEYIDLSHHFAALSIVDKSQTNLQQVKTELEKIISTYQVGEKSNPVGYSGLLGLKGVLNRVKGQELYLKMQSTEHRDWINEKLEFTQDWQAKPIESIETFSQNHLSEMSSNSYSSLLLANQLKVQSMQNMTEMERARFLPRVGLFAQNNLYAGDRDNENSQTIGLYFMWDLFNPDSFGRFGESKAKANAALAQIQQAKTEQNLMKLNLTSSKTTIEETLKILEDNQRILAEQTQAAMRLFRSGMLTALQLAEVLNRRVDLIENKFKVENNYLEVRTRIYQLHN